MRHYIVIGSSKGIGQALSQKILDNGDKVSGFSRGDASIKHANYDHHLVDVLQAEYPEMDKADALIFCPGNINLKPISMLKDKDFEQDFQLNTLSAVKAVQHFLPALKKGNRPQMLFFSTVAVHLGMPFHCSTAAAKGALEAFSKALAAELAPSIAVNCIAPTISQTPLGAKILRNEKVVEKLTDKHPMNHLPEASEIAEMAFTLCNGTIHSMSGQVITIDSGLSSLNIK